MDLQQQADLTAERAAARQQRELLEQADFKAVLSSTAGRRLLRRVLAECGVHLSSFNPDPAQMAFNEGRRAIGLWLQSLFAECPELYLQLLTENRHDANS